MSQFGLLRRSVIMRAVASVSCATALLAGGRLWAASIVQEFYLPMPEDQIRNTFTKLQTTGIGTTFNSVCSIVVTAPGTVIYYDQWEDGYEADIGNPTQPTTKIWGDGNDANGIPPGYTHDPAAFAAGTVLALTNLVSLPRNPSTVSFDGRDRIASTKAIVVSRAAWATTPGSVLASAVEVPATMDYGTRFVVPVGQDVSANGMFQYAGLFVMAGQDGTSVTIDPDGPGPSNAVTVVLNRGESYQVNGGILKGATVTASKPVQVDLATGKIGANYESRWFRLYPTEQWYSSYITPVGTSSNGNPAYVYLFNTNNSPLTINYQTQNGSGTLTIPGTNGIYQFQMPANSGARFTSAGNVPFYALSTVGANPTANQVYDWGFTLVPADDLTTVAVVGWGPGSNDGTQNGSPIWITPTSATRVYVDYNGDGIGAYTDPKGNKYDAAYDLAALQSARVYDPDKNQTAMRLYTLDGTPISAVWGEDPAVAGAGNPFIDAGTTVIPFPVPVITKTAALYTDYTPTGLSTNDILQYTITVNNKGLLALGNVVVIDDLPTNTLLYITNSTVFYADGGTNGTALPDHADATPFPLGPPQGYTVPIIPRGASSRFTFLARIVGAGSIVNAGFASDISASNTVVVPSSGGGSPSNTVRFVDAAGSPVTTYTAGQPIYIQITDAGANTSPSSTQTVTAVIQDPNSGDLQTVTLVETGTNTGIFMISAALPTSTTTGGAQQDGTLLVAGGDSLQVTYNNPNTGNSSTGASTVVAPNLTKVLYLSDPAQAMDRIDPVATGDNTATQTAVLANTGSDTISASATTSSSTNGTTLTFAHTPGSGANRLLLVAVNLGSPSATDSTETRTVSSVTYGGTALTQVGTVFQTPVRSSIYMLLNPAPGPSNIVVTANTASSISAGATTFNNVNQSSPTGTFASVSGSTGTSNSLVVTSATGQVVFSTASWDVGSVAQTVTPGSGQSSLWSISGNTSTRFIGAAASTKPGAASVANIYVANDSQQWAISAVPIKPASGGGGGVSSVAFTQAPPFALSFTMSSGGVVRVTNFVTVTSGTMPANPSITATLNYSGTNVIVLGNPTYNSGTSALVWSGTLANSVTVPANASLVLTITTAQSGVGFQINHDSIASPSKVLLPTTNVIAIANLGVYGASYPATNTVATGFNGNKLYVRVIATDPFGAYDINGISLAVAGPTPGSSFTVNLTDAQVVASNAFSKTYEYAWQTGSDAGPYSISATANEGTEGITASAVTSVNLTTLDLGTPSTTEFTISANGASTNSYATNQMVYVRVTDLNRNTNTGVVDTVTVTVVNQVSGDSETLTLYETGPNTGIFTNGLPASATGGAGANNGLLNAPAGSTLAVTYSDPTDLTDTSSATATVPVASGTPAAIAVQKMLVSPASGLALVGDTVQFNIKVINSGGTTVSTVTVTDRFPANNLTYLSATPAPTTTGNGTSTWSNVGPLVPGQQTNISVFFTAIASAAPATNTAVADAGGGLLATNQATVTLVQPALTITKTILSPIPGPAAVGDNVQYRIVVRNTGSTSIPTLPMEDTFSGAYLQYVSASITPDGIGSGSLLWTNMAAAGSLTPGRAITNDITLRAVGGGNPALNAALVNYAVDQYGNSVPSASASTGIVTTAATINGSVYTDTNGVYHAGDAAIQNVTITLYTDPNGDGNPSDGTVVGIAGTLANGYYEFLNLSTGRYIIVETDLPGYASSGDVAPPNDNRIPLYVSNLIAYTNQNFFDYVPAPTNYASISGTVYLDVNGNGVADDGAGAVLSGVTIDLIQDLNTNGVADVGEPVAQTVQTGANGVYQFGGVIAGPYVVRETDLSGYVSTADTALPNNNLIPVTALAGGSSTNNNFLDLQLCTLGDFVWVDSNGNGQQDADEPGLSDAVVRLYTNNVVLATVTSTVAGAYSFTNLMPGTYTVGFTPPAGYLFTTPNVGYDTTDSDPLPGTNRTAAYTLTSGQIENTVDAGFYQATTINGNVWLDVNGNGTRDSADTNGIAGATITLLNSASNVVATVVTTGTGAFNFTNLPPGTYTVVQTPPQVCLPTTPVTVSVIVASGATGTVSFLDLPVFSIGNHVFNDINNDGNMDSGENGIAGVRMVLFAADGAGHPTGSALMATNTDAHGDYRFDYVVAGTYVEVVDKANSTNLNNYASSTGASTDTTLAGDANDHGLDLPVTVGTVTNGIASTPVTVGLGLQPLGELTANQAGMGTHGPSGDAGDNLVMYFGFTPTYSLGNRVFSDANNNGTIDGADAGISNVVVKLFAADVSGNPVTNVLATAVTDANGYYRFDGLVAGNYVAVVDQGNSPSLAGYTSSTGANTNTLVSGDGYDHGNDTPITVGSVTNGIAGVAVTLGAGQQPTNEATAGSGAGANGPNGDANDNLTMDFGFTPAYSLGNRVFLDNGAGGGTNNNGVQDGTEPGISNVVTRLFAADVSGNPTGNLLTTATTDANGFYRFDGLTTGRYVVVVDVAASPALASLASSTGYSTDLALTGDQKDHGKDNPLAAGSVLPGGIAGVAVTLGAGLQPTGEATAAGAGAHGPSGDAGDNLVMDFGFAPTYSLGNRVFLDDGAGGGTANNGVQDGTEVGIANVTVQLKTNGLVVATTTTDASGYYRFDGLLTGTYTAFLPVSNFQVGGALAGKLSSPGTVAGDQGDKGVDNANPVTNGIGSASVTMGLGLQPTGETDIAGSGAGTHGPNGDADDNLTIDFGFVDANSYPCSIGSLVWHDANNNGLYDTGENGIAGVAVEVWSSDASGTLQGASPVATNVTAADGTYYIGNLTPGLYRVKIPTNNFAAGWPLSITNASSTLRSVQDDFVDSKNHGLQAAPGQVTLSPLISLSRGGEPVDGSGVPNEFGTGATLDNAADNNGNMTVDFGFYSPTADQTNLCSLGSLVWNDANNNGVWDTGETGIAGVTLELYQTNASGLVYWSATNSASDGTYFFRDLPSGSNWVVHIPVTNFTGSGALNAYPKSSGTPVNADNQTDNDNNGLQPAGLGTEVWSPVIHLAAGSEPANNLPSGPSGEFGTGYGQDNAGNYEDANGDMTVDFGFTPTYSLGNRVFADANNNGMRDVAETGISDVLVRLFAADGSGNPTGIVLAATTTDANGYYRFDDLLTGGYVVVVDKANSANLAHLASSTGASTNTTIAGDEADHGRDTPVTIGPVTNGIAGVAITLGAGLQPTGEATGAGAGANGPNGDASDNLTMDFGFTPTYSIGNRVVRDPDNDGEPDLENLDEGGITNVHLVVFAADGSGNPTGTALAMTITDAEGYYRFDGLVAATYVIVVDKTNSPSLSTYLCVTKTSTNLSSSGNMYNHGIATPLGAGSVLPGGIASVPVTVGPGLQPVGEGVGTGQGGNGPTGDANDILVVDFGFYPLYSVGNQVFVDANNNGIMDNGESGLSGVAMKLFAADGSGNPTGSVLAATNTDVNGYYRFDGLLSGRYAIVVDQASSPNLSGYVSSTGASTDPRLSEDLRDHGKDTPVSVGAVTNGTASTPVIMGRGDIAPLYNEATGPGAGAHGPNGDDSDNLTMDFGFYLPATIAGAVFVDVNGNGTSDATDTNGIPGATVLLLDAASNVVATVATGPTGAFTFPNLPPGAYTLVEVNASGWVSTGVDQHTLTVTSGQASTGNTFLDTQATTVSGSVLVDLNGNGAFEANDTNGIAGVTVQLLNASSSVVATTTTTDNGAYAFTNIMPGVYTVRETDLPGYRSTTQTGGGTNNLVAATVTSGTPVAGNDFYDAAYVSISGAVNVDMNGNGIIDADDANGIAGVTLQLLDASSNVVATTTTEANGAYTFTNVMPGAYTVRETDLLGWYSTTDTSAPNDNQVPVTLASGQSLTGNNFYDATYATLGDFVWVDLNGNGIQDGGNETNGLSNVVVRIYDSHNAIVGTATSSVAGAYTFTNLLPGTYTVDFTPPAGYVFTASNVGNDATDSDPLSGTNRTAAITLVSGQSDNTVDAGFYLPATLRGYSFVDQNDNRVRDAGDGVLSNLTVTLWLNSSQIGTTTAGTNGLYQFANLPPGDYTVVFGVRPADFTQVQSLPTNAPADTDPERTRAEVSETNMTASITVLSGDGVLAGYGEPINIGFIPNTTAAQVLIRAYATADGVMVEFTTIQERGRREIVLYLYRDGQWVVVGKATPFGSGDHTYRFLAPGLSAGDICDLKVRDDEGHYHAVTGLTVGNFAAQAVLMEKSGLWLQWESIPERTYDIYRTDRLGGTWDLVDTVAATETTTLKFVSFDPSKPAGFFKIVMRE